MAVRTFVHDPANEFNCRAREDAVVNAVQKGKKDQDAPTPSYSLTCGLAAVLWGRWAVQIFASAGNYHISGKPSAAQ